MLGAGGSLDSAQAAASHASGHWSTLGAYFSLGMHHLLQGYDHPAFLMALVLPLQLSLRFSPRTALLYAVSGGAAAVYTVPVHASGVFAGPSQASRASWLALLRTVTAFTIGHSITLMLATFGLTQASPLWVEPAIALSIAVTALLNLHPVKWIRVDVLALLFGLVHGRPAARSGGAGRAVALGAGRLQSRC